MPYVRGGRSGSCPGGPRPIEGAGTLTAPGCRGLGSMKSQVPVLRSCCRFAQGGGMIGRSGYTEAILRTARSITGKL